MGVVSTVRAAGVPLALLQLVAPLQLVVSFVPAFRAPCLFSGALSLPTGLLRRIYPIETTLLLVVSFVLWQKAK